MPIIDFSGWYSGEKAQRLAIAEELYRAATSTGFFYLSGHGVADEVISNAYAASANFHAQSANYKKQYDIALSKVHRGWASMEQTSGFELNGQVVKNYYEAFDLAFDLDAADSPSSQGYGLVGPNVWPDLPEFKRVVSTYYEAIYQLGRTLMSAFEFVLDLESGTFLQHVNVPTSQLRLLKYFANDAANDEFNTGISAHSDYECFTILDTSGPGLQLLSYDGHWVEAPPQPGAFIVNIGDCLEAFTGGVFKATQHRVVNLGKERYSLPFFFAFDFDTEVKPLPGFSNEESVRRYPPFQAGEHLWARTIQTFPYLKRLYKAGDLPVDFAVAEENPFLRLSHEEIAAKEAAES